MDELAKLDELYIWLDGFLVGIYITNSDDYPTCEVAIDGSHQYALKQAIEIIGKEVGSE